MIRLNELIEDMKQSKNKYYANTTSQVHLSNVAICGFKYRYEKENNISVPYSTKYMFGLGIEDYLVNQIKRRDNSYISHFLVNLHIEPDVNIVGSTDVCSLKYNHIIEIKTSSSDKYKDIYLRQLKAYMVAYKENFDRDCTGSLWIYNTFSGNLEEIFINEITAKDITELALNIGAYRHNQYYNGIENSLCGLCVNVECPANKARFRSKILKEKLEVI